MNERYTRLFSLPNNLYLDGAPLIIAAGALLKDSRSGEVLVQLKLQNLHHAVLTSCKVHVRAFDPSGAELEGVDSFSYLDLQVSRGEDFGAKTPIGLPDSTTRRVSVCVIQAVFDDGGVWQNPVCEWTQPEVRAQLLSDKLGSDELVRQYELEVGENCKYVPETVGNLSLCTCGAINLAGEKVCSQCHRELKTLAAAMDVPALTKKMKERLAAEAARKKHNKKLAIITASSAAAIVAVVLVVTQVIIPAVRYNSAEKLLAAEDYDGAIAAFTELGDYKDSAERTEEAVAAKEEVAAAKEEAASAAKEEAASAAKYAEAEQLFSSGEYDRAINLFKELGDYHDSKIYVQKCEDEQNQPFYNEAVAFEENGELGKAAIAFGKLGGFSDAKDKSAALWEKIACRSTLAAGGAHTVGLKSDGTVVAVGYNYDGQCDVSKWTDIVAIAAGNSHTVGLKSDGTVVAVGYNYSGQCNVSGWTDIVAIAAEGAHTVGLKSDGTVVAVGYNDDGQCNVSGWTGIKMPK